MYANMYMERNTMCVRMLWVIYKELLCELHYIQSKGKKQI